MSNRFLVSKATRIALLQLSVALAVVVLAPRSEACPGPGTCYSIDSTQGDDTLYTNVSTYTGLGSSGNGVGTPGVCYMVSVNGNFRGKGEFMNITGSSSGYYEIEAASHYPGYGGAADKGPGGTMECLSATQLGIPSGHLSNYTTTFKDPNAYNYFLGGAGLTDDTVSSNDFVPWSGVGGFMWWDNASAQTEVTSQTLITSVPSILVEATNNFSTNTICNSWPQCQITTYAWDNGSSVNGEAFSFNGTYYNYECDLTGNDGHGGPTCELASGYSASSPTSVCWISGIAGFWDHNSKAVITGSGTHWYLDMYQDSQGNSNVWGYATCMVYPQTGL